MEVPRLGIESELPLPAYTTATANSGSEAHLPPTPQLTATRDPWPTEWGQGSDAHPHGYLSDSLLLCHSGNSKDVELKPELCSCSGIICEKCYLASPKLPSNHCQKLAGRICTGMFLVSWFCSMDPCAYPSVSTTWFWLLYLYRSWDRVNWCLPFYLSLSKLFQRCYFLFLSLYALEQSCLCLHRSYWDFDSNLCMSLNTVIPVN